MSRIVVTGGSGFVGSHLVDHLLTQGHNVTVYDAARGTNASTAAEPQVCHVEGDIRDADRLADAIKPGVDVVYHLAAVVGVDQYLARPLDVIDTNITGTRNVLVRAAEVGAKVVVASTSEVFGKNPDVPWSENADRILGATSADRWTYASSKALAEHLTFAFVRQHQVHASIVRYFNVYGPRQRPAYVVSRSVHRALNGRAPVVYDKGRQTRCFTYVDDAVRGTVLVGSGDHAGEAFNLGSMVETRVADVVRQIGELTGVDLETRAVDTSTALGAPYEDVPRRVPDSSKAQSVLGWSCSVPLAEGLGETIEWARRTPWWLALPDTGAS